MYQIPDIISQEISHKSVFYIVSNAQTMVAENRLVSLMSCSNYIFNESCVYFTFFSTLLLRYPLKGVLSLNKRNTLSPTNNSDR